MKIKNKLFFGLPIWIIDRAGIYWDDMTLESRISYICDIVSEKSKLTSTYVYYIKLLNCISQRNTIIRGLIYCINLWKLFWRNWFFYGIDFCWICGASNYNFGVIWEDFNFPWPTTWYESVVNRGLKGIKNIWKFFIYERFSREIDDKRMAICSISVFAASLFRYYYLVA